MAFSRGSLALLVVLCGALAAPMAAQAMHSIPKHLVPCYRNASLFHRENRLPSSMATVVQLLKTIENWPGFSMDLRTFALSLLHMFRVDGIERDADIIESEYVTPYSPSGQQYYKHRVLMTYLIPQPSYQFPNDSLTMEEMCSLHFWLSNSVDMTNRGDESVTCALISSRKRRQVDDADQAGAEHDDDTGPNADDGDASAHDDADALPDIQGVEDVESPDSAAAPNPPLVPQAPASRRLNPDAEAVPDAQGSGGSGDGEQKGDMRWAEDGGVAPAAPPSRRGRLEAIKSQCPVEGGVIRTRWGSVQLGTLLAGIAAGFDRQTVQLTTLRSLSSSQQKLLRNLDGLSVDNLWAATLAGDLAEVALFQGPKSSTITVGAVGNWNSTGAPRWYFVHPLTTDPVKVNDMTDAEIRGGIDGLIIGTYVKQWYQTWNSKLTLSSLLDRYYSTQGVVDPDIRACRRQDHFAAVAPQATAAEQAYNFAYPLRDHVPVIVNIEDQGVEDFTSRAVDALLRYVPSDNTGVCETSSSYTDRVQNTRPVVDLKLIIDCSWNYYKMKSFVENLAQEINLSEKDPGSSITVYSAQDLRILFNTTRSANKLSVHLNHNQTEYIGCSQGMQLKSILETPLKELYRYDLDREKNESDVRINAKVTVLMPGQSHDLSTADAEAVKEIMSQYRTEFPDVKFLIFTTQVKDNYKSVVENEEDIVTFTYNENTEILSSALSAQIKTVHRRVANPVCGANWTERDYGSRSHIDYVGKNLTAFYRINSKYLYGVSSETIKIQEEYTGTIRVCYSRKSEYPSSDDTLTGSENADVTCKDPITGTYVDIPLDKPCSGQSHFRSCPHLYISVEATETKYQCSDEGCKDADDVKISITHSKLTCGAGTSLASSTVLALTTILLTISKVFFS